MSIYKKFTAQDFATVPFNAHKQYDLKGSASLATFSLKHFSTQWTSESISAYSSASLPTHQLLFDNINNTKYNQIDHLFYKNYKRDIGNKFGPKHYLKHRRELYEHANVLSIPTGLYGYEVKPGTFSLTQASAHTGSSQGGLPYINIIDDFNGNLLISGTNVNEYPLDIRSNLFKIDPIKGFKRYDLNTFDGYYNEVFYLDGKEKVDKTFYYTSPDSGEYDDSYYFNPIKYEKVQFVRSTLGISSSKFPAISFDSSIGSRIISPDSEKFNFNSEEDFAISFNMKTKPTITTTTSIGEYLAGGQVFAIDNDFAYIVVNPDPSFALTGGDQVVRSLDNRINIQNEFVPGTEIIAAPASFSIEFGSSGIQSNSKRITIQSIDASGNILTVTYRAKNNNTSISSTQQNFDCSSNLPDVRAASFANAVNNAHQGTLIATHANNGVSGIVTITNAHPGVSGNSLIVEAQQYGIGNPNGSQFNLLLVQDAPTSFSGGVDGSPGTSNSTFQGDEHFKSKFINISPTLFNDSAPLAAVSIADMGVSASGYARFNDEDFILPSVLDPNDGGLDHSDFTGTPIPGTGRTNTIKLLEQSNDPDQDFPIPNFVANETISELGLLYTDEAPWIASYDEIVLIQQNIGFTIDLNDAQTNNKIFLSSNSNFSDSPFAIGNPQILTSNLDPLTTSPSNPSFTSHSDYRHIFVFPPVTGFTPTMGITGDTVNNPGLGGTLASTPVGVPPTNQPAGNILMIQRIPFNFLDKNKRYIISKSTTKTVVPTPLEGRAGLFNTRRTGSSQFKNVEAEPQFPFEIYLRSSSIFFERSDGDNTTIISGALNTNIKNKDISVLCQKSSSTLEIYMNGEKVASGVDATNKQTQNNANLYIGSKGDNSKLDGTVAGTQDKDAFFRGELSNINIYENFFTQTQINNISESINGSPYIGNIFYQHGFATVTHPKYQDIIAPYGPELFINPSFQGIPDGTDAADLTTLGPLTATLPGANDTANINEEQLDLSLDNASTGGLTFSFSTSPGKVYLLKTTITGDPVRIVGSNIIFPNLTQAGFEDPGALENLLFNLTGEVSLIITAQSTSADLSFLANNGTPGVAGFSTFENISLREIKHPFPQFDTSSNTRYNINPISERLDDFLFAGGGIGYRVEFQGSHLIYEHEYQCTVDEHEFNNTMNISARKIKSDQSEDIADFATGSLFRPYVTTIGLYNEDKELLVVGKLAQPIRTSDETDTTFIVRWDT